MKNQFRKTAMLILIAYMVIAVGFYMIAQEQLHFEDSQTGMVTASTSVGEILPDSCIRQRLTEDSVQIKSISLRVTTYARANTAHLLVTVLADDGTFLYSTELDGAQLQDNEVVSIVPETPIQVPEGQGAMMVLTSPDAAPGNALSVMMGSAVSVGRAELTQKIPENMQALVNDVPQEAKLCFRVQIRRTLLVGDLYGYGAAALGIALALYLVHVGRLLQQGKTNVVINIVRVTRKYSFLMRQVVMRDFKTKYKRSVLGVFWSFLNPLFTMMVQYVVFSMLFKSDIEKYPLYLLTGIITFNFFNEATSEASNSIVINTPLITKVYIPKVIFPVCSIIFSTLNLLISFILLVMVMLVTQTYPTAAFLLAPYGILCLVCFSAGVGLVLSTYMVFFKDVQFLWNIFIMLWMYATPIFYPETIIPEPLMPIYRLNPLYHFVTFLRTIMIKGVSPSPSAYLACFLCAVIPLAVGLWVFRRNQDKFIFSL